MNNIISILSGIAMIGASALTMEGINKATDGNFYLASVKYLAEDTINKNTFITPNDNREQQPTITSPSNESSESNFNNLSPIIDSQNSSTQPKIGEQKNNLFQQFIGVFENKQNIQPQTIRDQQQNQKKQPNQFQQAETEDGQSINPERIQNGLRDITRFRTELKNILRQIRKQASSSDLEELVKVQTEVDKIYSDVSNSSASDFSTAEEVIQNFYDGEYYDKINKIRTRIQIPQELKQIQQSLRRVDKILKTKAVQSLSLNIDKAKELASQMKQSSDKIQELYNAGNYEDAGDLLQELRDNGHPGDIESTISRVRDIKNTLKRIKDTEVKVAVEKILQEVIDKFNNGEYRDARETLDEYSDDLMKMVNQFAKVKTLNRSTSKTQIKNLGNLIEKKLQEIDIKQGQVQTEPQVTPAESGQ